MNTGYVPGSSASSNYNIYTKFAPHLSVPSVASVWVARSILADIVFVTCIWYKSKMRLHAYIAVFNYHTNLT